MAFDFKSGSGLGNAPQKRVLQDRVPMSVPRQKLAVPEIDGYHLHWMMGEPGRIDAALRAGYTFVMQDEVETSYNSDIAGDAESTDTSDLGTRVSMLASRDAGEDGQAARLYLMKIPMEYWMQDQAAVEERNEQVASSIRNGTVNPNQDNSYVPKDKIKQMDNLFHRKPKKLA